MPDSPSIGFQITSDPDHTRVATPQPRAATERPDERRCRFLYVGDLDPQATTAPTDAHVRSVDASSFADMMRAWAPAMEVSVADHLGSDLRRTVAWRADGLDAFTPAGLVARIPALTSLAAARTALDEARGGRVTLDALRARLAETGIAGADALADAVARRPGAAAPAPSPADDPLDRLLGMVGGDHAPADVPAASPPGGVLDALVGAAVGDGAERSVDADAAARAVAGLDARLRAQVVALLDHPDVRRLEAAWRGLKFLVDRLAFRQGARLDILAATRDALDETLHHAVLLPEHAEGAARDPLAAILVNHDADATSADFALLGELAATGASLQVPVVLSASPALFGLGAPTDFARLPPVVALMEQPPYAAWRSLRQRPDASFLVLALPPFVLRPAYGEAHPDRAHGVEGGDVLWGGGVLLAGAALAARHAETGWPTPPAGQRVEGLTVRTTRMGAMPLAASFSESVLHDLARAGFTAFAGPLNTDHAVLGPPATVGRPADGSPDATAHARLPTAVFTALAAHRALGLSPDLAGLGADAARERLDAQLRAWLRTGSAVDEDAVTVQVLDEHETEAAHTLGVRLRPPPQVLPGGVGVVLGVESAKAAPAGDAA